MESLKFTLRKHPVIGWTIILFAGLLVSLTVVNQALDILKMLGLLG